MSIRPQHELALDGIGQPSPEWFDAQYNNRARIPEHLAILREWDEAAVPRYAA